MSKQLKSALLTHGLIIVGFFLITLIIHYPSFTEGKEIRQHDILQSQGANHQIQEINDQTGEESLWNPYMFSGMPAYLTGVGYSGDLLQYVYRVLILGLNHETGLTFLGLLSFYILLLSFKVRPWIAFMGAIAFSLNGFNIISITAGHNAKISAVVLIPLVLAGIHLAFTKHKYLGFGLTALALALQIRANHPQITYYLLLITIAYGISELYHHWKRGELPKFGISMGGLVIAAVLAVGANAGKLMTTYEYSKYSIRGKSELTADQQQSSGLDREYAFRYSNGILEPVFLFIPNILGGSSMQKLDDDSATAKALESAGYNRAQLKQQLQSMPTYWGDQPLTAPYYAGSVVFLLFVLGIIVLSREQKVWLLAIAIVGIIMSWGSNFTMLNDLLFDHLPLYNKFRSVTFTIIMTIVAVNLLAFMALDRIWEYRKDKLMIKRLYLAVAIAGGFALVLVVFAGVFSYKGNVDSRLPEWLISAIRADRQSLLRSDALRTLFFVVAFGGLVWAYLSEKLSMKLIISGMIVLVFIDMFGLTRRFINKDSFEKSPLKTAFRPSESDQVLQKLTEPGDRVLNLQNPFNDAITSYFHESVGGYHGAKLRRYQDLISHCIEPELSSIITDLQAGKRNLENKTPVLNMLNTTYYKAGPSKNAVLQNPYALGEAWTVNTVEAVNSPDEEISKVCQINSAEQAVVDASMFEIPASLDGSGDIKLKSKTPNELIYEADIQGAVLGVFSEIYYPKGWKAFVDGKEVDILRANYVLRALPLSSGSHEIKFSFEPKSYTTGNTITWIGNILVILIFVGSGLIEFRKNSKKLTA